MSYDKELQFLLRYLKHLHIPYRITATNDIMTDINEMDIRKRLGLLSLDEKLLSAHIQRIIHNNMISYLTDEFLCQYIAFALPESDKQILIMGPYLTGSLTHEERLKILEQKSVPSHWLPQLSEYYRNLTTLSDDNNLISCIFALGDYMWGEENYRLENYIQGLPNTMAPVAIPYDAQRRLDAFANSQQIEQVYEYENNILQAVAHGRSSRAKALIQHFSDAFFEQRAQGVRNMQNYAIVVNTLMRKAAEQGGVHPIYINQLSSTFAHRIEATTRMDAFPELWNDMIQKYCTLVNKHSIRNYSLPIQKVITRIDFDLTADLSLRATAQYLNMNASYLSKLFKKETGFNLSDYVNMKRMEYAAYQLSTTRQPVSAIAQSCGILDDNYFTKLFRRYHGMTPTQFRQQLYLR